MSFHVTLLLFSYTLVDSDFSQNVKKALRIRKVRFYSSLSTTTSQTHSFVNTFVRRAQGFHPYPRPFFVLHFTPQFFSFNTSVTDVFSHRQFYFLWQHPKDLVDPYCVVTFAGTKVCSNGQCVCKKDIVAILWTDWWFIPSTIAVKMLLLKKLRGTVML